MVDLSIVNLCIIQINVIMSENFTVLYLIIWNCANSWITLLKHLCGSQCTDFLLNKWDIIPTQACSTHYTYKLWP